MNRAVELSAIRSCAGRQNMPAFRCLAALIRSAAAPVASGAAIEVPFIIA
jgi:hypothetical protein